MVNLYAYIKQLKATLLCFMLCLILLPHIATAKLTLSLDSTEISVEEAFEISLSSNNATSSNIDISPLQQDFEILDQYKQSRVQIINGNMSQSTTWTYTLIAKHAGKITIPAISVGNESSKAVEINVKKGTANNNLDIILEAEIEQKSAYVQGQFIYIQRLLFAKSIRNSSTLSKPSISTGLAEIEPLGNHPIRTVRRNGHNYSMLTRRFAVTPQQSGKLTIAPSVFSGTMSRSNQRYSNSIGFHPRSRRIRVRSNEVSIQIKPRPAEFTGKDWIVAKNFSLHLNWSTPPDQLKAGDHATLTLAAIADGLHAEQLPEIKLQAPKGIKLYPEKPSFNNERNLDGIIGTVNKNIILLPTAGGEFKIPAVNIPWWNSETHQQETATLEAMTLKVSGTAMPISQIKPITTKKPKVQNTPIKKQPRLSTTLIIILSLSLLGLLFWFGQRWQKQRIKQNINSLKLSQKQQLKNLKQACESNNAKKAQHHLQQWKHTPASPQLQQQIQILNQALYAKNKSHWQGEKLWQAVQIEQQTTADNRKNKHPKQQKLQPLYLQ